jgi:hypothetical protein
MLLASIGQKFVSINAFTKHAKLKATVGGTSGPQWDSLLQCAVLAHKRSL